MRCRGEESSYYQLSCEHVYCLVCCAYRHIKLLSLGREGSLLECEVCERVTELDEETIALLRDKVKEEIMPRINERLQQRKEEGFSTPKGKSWLTASMIRLDKQCGAHPREPQEYRCLTCQAAGLCWKCISGHRNHQLLCTRPSHQLRDQAQLSALEARQRMEELVLHIQRMNTLSGILAQRH
jgi:hypothetical protein